VALVSPLKGRSKGSSSVERGLLTAYWLLSGYGLRASRAVTALCALVLIGTALYAHLTFASLVAPTTEMVTVDSKAVAVTNSSVTEDKGAVDFTTALEHAARQAISLIQQNPSADVKTTHWGMLVDSVLRLRGPALLALAVLAIRGRTKR